MSRPGHCYACGKNLLDEAMVPVFDSTCDLWVYPARFTHVLLPGTQALEVVVVCDGCEIPEPDGIVE